MEEQKYMVRVSCMTYNHAPYIEDAMNGFSMQETTFPFVCTIIDDASTDGEPEVIKKYLQEHFDIEDKDIVRNEETDDYIMTFARHKTNQNCFFAVLLLKYNHYSIKKTKRSYIKEWCDTKYVALCEGDDYWTEPRKLQMQYDYLESHSHVVLSCHRYSILDLNTGEITLAGNAYYSQRSHHKETEFEFDLNYYLNNWVTKTLTCMYRRDAVNLEYYKGFKYARDVHLFYYIMTKGRGVCHAFNGGLYRKNVPTSIFGNLTEVAQTSINSKVYEELASVTQDPLVRRTAQRSVATDCANRLKPLGGGYYYAIKVVSKCNWIVNIIKRGFKRLPPISD